MLGFFQDDVREQLQLRKRLTAEVVESHRIACERLLTSYPHKFKEFL